MKVYIVIREDYDECVVVKAFDSYLKAVRFYRQLAIDYYHDDNYKVKTIEEESEIDKEDIRRLKQMTDEELLKADLHEDIGWINTDIKEMDVE